MNEAQQVKSQVKKFGPSEIANVASYVAKNRNAIFCEIKKEWVFSDGSKLKIKAKSVSASN